MKKIYKITVLMTAIVVMLTTDIYAQDVRYSQPFSNPLTLNPALGGMNNDLKVILNHRIQWAGLTGGDFTTSSFTGLYPVFLGGGENKMDFGLNAVMENVGAYQNFYVSAAIGYSLKISESNNLSFSVTGGYIQKSLDIGSLTFDDQYVLGSYSPSNPTNETVLYDKKSYPDVGFGILWHSSLSRAESKLNGYLGVSGYHLTMPKESFTDETGVLERRFSYLGGIKIFGENKVDFTPNVIVTTQGGAYETSAGLYVDFAFSSYGKLTLGGWYRQDDAIACLVNFEYSGFGIGYSYDIPNSGLGNSITGLNTHEISLFFRMNMKDRNSYDDDEEDYDE